MKLVSQAWRFTSGDVRSNLQPRWCACSVLAHFGLQGAAAALPAVAKRARGNVGCKQMVAFGMVFDPTSCPLK